MPFSLADCILSHNDPERARTSRAPGAGAPAGTTGTRTDRSLPPQIEEAGFSVEELARIRALFDEVSQEWTRMVEAVQALKRTLEPQEFAQTLRSARREARSIRQDGVKAPAKAPSPLATSTSSTRADGDTPAKSVAEKQEPRPRLETAAAREPATRESPAASPIGNRESPDVEIKDRLGELLKLLKEHLAAKAQGTSPQRLEIPKSLTLEIAREVAGRVKDSVLSGLRHGQSPEAPAEERKASGQPVDKRIPLDDLGAIIDQITGQG